MENYDKSQPKLQEYHGFFFLFFSNIKPLGDSLRLRIFFQVYRYFNFLSSTEYRNKDKIIQNEIKIK